MRVAHQGDHQPKAEGRDPAALQPTLRPGPAVSLPPEHRAHVETRHQSQHIAQGHRKGRLPLREQGHQQRNRHHQGRIQRQQRHEQQRQAEGQHKAQGGPWGTDERLQQSNGAAQHGQQHRDGPPGDIGDQVAEFLLQKTIRQRGIHQRLDPRGNQHHPQHRNQHQNSTRPPRIRAAHTGPQAQGEQHQSAIFPHKEQQRRSQGQEPPAAIQQRAHHQKTQQWQPDQIVEVLQHRANHGPAEVIGGGEPHRQCRSQASGRQAPEHKTCRREQAHLHQRQSPWADQGHQRRDRQRQKVGVLPQMQIVDAGQSTVHSHSP